MTRTVALLALLAFLRAEPVMAKTGDSQICKWKDCKIAAFSIGGDDSLRSQTTFAIPAMTQRGIYGTWWVNTGRGRNELGFDFIDDEACWAAAVKAGHDLANHTLHHTGARSANDAEWEIGENARRIWAIQPDTKMLLFERGGGTVWDTSEGQIAHLLKQYHCVDGRGAPGIDSPAWLINHSAAELRGFVDAAIKDGNYHYIIFHGIGPKAEWGGQTDGDAFISLLDYLVAKREVVWSDTATKIYKYVQERDHSTISTKENSGTRIRLSITTDLDTSKGMFDYPITLKTEVPSGWKTCTVRQAGRSAVYPVREGVVEYSALPNSADITITPGGTLVPATAGPSPMAAAPPAPPDPPVPEIRVIDDFDHASDAELNSAWWPLACGNNTQISRGLTASKHGMKYVYRACNTGTSGLLRRNTSLDLGPYRFLLLKFKPSNTSDSITIQFMEALQSEFWESSFLPVSTESQTVAIPLTREFFHHPTWFKGADADGVIDLRNIKLMSLLVGGNKEEKIVFERIAATTVAPVDARIPAAVSSDTPALSETGRCMASR